MHLVKQKNNGEVPDAVEGWYKIYGRRSRLLTTSRRSELASVRSNNVDPLIDLLSGEKKFTIALHRMA